MMCIDAPRIDLLPFRCRADRLVIAAGFELAIEFEAALPPLIEIDLAVADGAKPFSWFSLDRKFELASRQKLKALEPEPRAVHRVLGVVPELVDQLFAAATPPLTVTAAAKPSRRRAWDCM